MAVNSLSGGTAVGAWSTRWKDIKHRTETEEQFLSMSGSCPRIVRSVCPSLNQFVVLTDTLSYSYRDTFNEPRGLFLVDVSNAHQRAHFARYGN